MATIVILIAIGSGTLGCAGSLIAIGFAKFSAPPKLPRLTKAEQEKLIEELDEWRSSAIDNAQTPDQLDKITEYYEARRDTIEHGERPIEMPKSIAQIGGK
jgi:hypothetical protein